MLTYRNIKPEEHWAGTIFLAELKAPQWFKDASAVWHPDIGSFMDFWRGCGEIWGLFQGDDLAACVYLEFLSPVQVNIHISVLAKVPEKDMIRFFVSLKDQKARDGIEIMTGWLLDRNRGLRRIATEAGFLPTGLVMDYGQSKGKVLKWVQVRGV